MTNENYDPETGLAIVDDSEALKKMQEGIDAVERLKEGESIDTKTEGLEDTENESDQSDEDLEEESNEESEEETFDDPEFEEEIVLKSQKSKKGNSYRKLQNDKYRALAEAEALRKRDIEKDRRIQYLEEELNQTRNSGVYHYGKNLYAELDRAKESKEKALNNGDANALIAADIAVVKAMQKIDELERWAEQDQSPRMRENEKNYNSYEPSYESEYQNENIYPQQLVQNWLSNHPSINPVSKYYNQNKAANVTKFVNQLDANLEKSGQLDALFTEDYFDTIDEYIESLEAKSQKVSKNIQSLSHVSGVKSSSSSASGLRKTPTTIHLTDYEKEMARAMNLTEQEWVKSKNIVQSADKIQGR